ncbi:MAG TPA: hypothetical protein VGO09_04795, partial [Flavisolibacter sp.]|nr:hypothetical protein [Flavisolibacter sp.]
MKYYILRIAFSFIFIPGICFSQQKLQYKQLLKQYSEAEKYYEKAVQLGLQKKADENEELKYNQIA